jgi:hypothetical protein
MVGETMRKMLIVTLCFFGHSAFAGVESTSEAMDFDTCIKTIQMVSAKLGIAPTNIVETPQLRMVKFYTSDGSVLISCSKPDRKRVVTVTKN